MIDHTVDSEPADLVTRREAIGRVMMLFGGVALVGGTGLLTGCREDDTQVAAADSKAFTTDDVAFLDEVADTMLPATKTPGAKEAKVGAFMALMVTDSYSPADQKIFRQGMKAVEDASQKANSTSFMKATPAQRLAVLQTLDKEQKSHSDARDAAHRKDALERRSSTSPAVPDSVTAGKPGASDAHLPDQRKENSPAAPDAAGAASAITKDTPAHYFRMMKELALLGYFTSEIGCKTAQQYIESPGRYDPCIPYTAGTQAWASHA